MQSDFVGFVMSRLKLFQNHVVLSETEFSPLILTCLKKRTPFPKGLNFAPPFSKFGSKKQTSLMPYVNSKGADQPVHLRSLISTFVVGCLDSIIPILAKSKVSRLVSIV